MRKSPALEGGAEAPGTRFWGPFALGAAGVAGIGVGSYYGLRAVKDKNDRDQLCNDGPLCKPGAKASYSDAQFSAAASTIAFGAGALCIAAGVAWWLLTPPRTRPHGAVVKVSPLAGPGIAGVVLGGTL